MNIREKVFSAEIRAASGADGLTTISGYAAVYNSRSEDLGGFVEVLAPGCFTKTLSENNSIKCLWNHNQDYVLGSRKAGTLDITDDDKGLKIECRLTPGVTFAQDFAKTVSAGSVDQMSYMFAAVRDSWSRDADGTQVRTILEAKLYEVSPVCFPAYEATSISARGIKLDLAESAMRHIKAAETAEEKKQLRSIIVQLTAWVSDDDEDDEDESDDETAPSQELTPSEQGSALDCMPSDMRSRLDAMRVFLMANRTA
jgi:HK97 family phage prohead protease